MSAISKRKLLMYLLTVAVLMLPSLPLGVVSSAKAITLTSYVSPGVRPVMVAEFLVVLVLRESVNEPPGAALFNLCCTYNSIK